MSNKIFSFSALLWKNYNVEEENKARKERKFYLQKMTMEIKDCRWNFNHFFFQFLPNTENDRQGIIFVTKGINPHKESRRGDHYDDIFRSEKQKEKQFTNYTWQSRMPRWQEKQRRTNPMSVADSLGLSI